MCVVCFRIGSARVCVAALGWKAEGGRGRSSVRGWQEAGRESWLYVCSTMQVVDRGCEKG